MGEAFAGDVLLYDDLDGGEIEIENGLVSADEGIRTGVYLSLFGGNRKESGWGKGGGLWWGNGIGESGELIRSRFQAYITGVPISVKALLSARNAAKKDLEWLLKEGEADEVTVNLTEEGKNSVLLLVGIRKDGADIFSGQFANEWEGV